MKNKTFLSFLSLALAILNTAACSKAQTQPPLQPETPPAAELLQPDRTAANTRELLSDLAQHLGCQYLTDSIMPISTNGAEIKGSRKPDAGSLWITKCQIQQTNTENVHIYIEATGWRWTQRNMQSLGATFSLDENVKFETTITATGTFDLVYTTESHIATIYFVPLEPLDVTFKVLGDLDVRTEDLWSSLIGQAAPVFGETTEKRAVQRIREKGIRRIRTRLEHGFTVIIDLCTSRHYFKLGHFDPGKLPEKATPIEGKDYAVNSHAELHFNSMLMAGPFEQFSTFYAKLVNTSDKQLRAVWLCKSSAEKIMRDYTQGRFFSTADALASRIIPAGQTILFYPPRDLTCPAVLLMLPVDGSQNPVSFDYAVIYPDRQPRPIIQCD